VFYGYKDFVLDGIARNELLLRDFECEYEIAYEKVDDAIPDGERVTRIECRQVQAGDAVYLTGTRYFADEHKTRFEIRSDGDEEAHPGFDTIDAYTNLNIQNMPMSQFLAQSETLSVDPTDIWNEFGAVVRVRPPSSTPENREEMKLVFRIEAGVVPFRVERYQPRLSRDPVDEYEVLDMRGLARGVRVPTKVRAVKYEMVNGWRVKRSECIVRVSNWTLTDKTNNQ